MVGLSGGYRAPSPLVPMRVFGGVGRMQVVPGPPRLTEGPGGKEAGGKEGMDQVGALRHHPEELEGKKIRKKKYKAGKETPFCTPQKPLPERVEGTA